jgi:lipopolysaccharide transport system permease protein
MIVFTVIFGHLAGISPGSDVPYPIFVFTGLLVWTYFASALSGASFSVIGNSSLVTKVYFPRLYVALAAVAAPVVDLVLSFVVLLALFGWYGRAPSWHLVFLPLPVMLTLLIGLGVGLWLAPVTVRYRDVPFALPFVVQLWMYATPVIYPASLVPHRWRWLLALNPVTAAVDGFRWCVVGRGGPNPAVLGASLGTTALLLVTGVAFFRRSERTFADLI